MAKDFSEVICQSLVQMGPEILENRVRFLAVIQDLGKDFQQERKLLSRCMDDKFIGYCVQVRTSSPVQLPAIQQRVREYMEHEYMVSQDWSDWIAHAMIYGIGRYFHSPAALEKPSEEKGEERKAQDMTAAKGDQTEILGSVIAGTAVGYAAPTGQSLKERSPLPPSTEPDEGNDPPPPPLGKKKFLIIGAAICLGIILGIALFVGLGVGEETGPSIEEKTGPVEVDAQEIEVLYTDIDWDSRSYNKNNGKYFDTDIILRVHNGSAENIIDMEISGSYKGGAKLTNLEGESEVDVIHVTGYIPAGTTGVMVCGITAPKTRKSEQLDNNSISVVSARTNHAMDHYEIPRGQVKEHNGEGDYYSVLINNNNDTAVNESAKLVAVVEDDVERYFEEADATGRLSQNIPANSTHYEKAAFVDPNFHVDFTDITVYVIDSDYYESAQ